jgi:hypothetical protein
MANAKPLLDQSGREIALCLHRDHVLPGWLHQWRRSTVRQAFALTERRSDILDTYRAKRASILYSIDEESVVRQSHNNPDIIRLYKDYLGGYGSEKAEELLHTTYVADRPTFHDLKK